MAKSLEERILSERARLRLPAEEKLSIVNAEAGPRTKEVLRDALRYESYAELHWEVFRLPIVVAETSGSTVRDIDGKEYIDCISAFGALNMGGCHPKVVEAIKSQVEHSMAYCEMPNETRIKLAKKLCELTPIEGERKVKWSVSGTEAADGMVKAARYYTGKPTILAFLGCYHGRDPSLTCDAHRRAFGVGALGSVSDVYHVPYAYCYRCVFGKEYPDCDMHCTRYIEELMSHSGYGLREPKRGISNVAGIIVEPIQGHAGFIIPPIEFLRNLRRICDEYGLLLLDDEVFSGVARSGRFWAIEHSSVKPDMISAGKSLAGGVSYSAIIGRSEIMDSWGPGGWCGTHMGNHLGAAAALASLEVVESEGLVAKATELGKYFLKGLQDLQKEHKLIGDVNGRGLFLGLELVKDRRTKERAYEEAGKIQYEAQKRGLLIRAAFNRIAPSPPLTIEKERIDRALEILGEAIREVERRS